MTQGIHSILIAPPRRCAMALKKEKENPISRDIVRCALEVHPTPSGPGLLENVYEEEPYNRGFLTLFSSPPTLKSKKRIPTRGPERFEMKSFT